MKASLTKLQTVSITSAHSFSSFCRFARFLHVKRVLRQLHCNKHKADPFSLDTLHLHHFSVMSLTSVLLQPGNGPFSISGSFLQGPSSLRKAHQPHGHRVSKEGTSTSQKAHQSNVIPMATAPCVDAGLIHIIHSNLSFPMGSTQQNQLKTP